MISIDKSISLDKKEFLDTLDGAEKFHGHLCFGMFSGIKATLLVKKMLGYDSFPNKDLIVISEIDRCLTDAIMFITGCRPGKRTMKLRDYGKFAATFCSLEHQQGLRISQNASAFQLLNEKIEAMKIDKHDKLTIAGIFFDYPWQDHYHCSIHDIVFDENDLPGYPKVRVQCTVCGELVMDNRHIGDLKNACCRPCALKSGKLESL